MQLHYLILLSSIMFLLITFPVSNVLIWWTLVMSSFLVSLSSVKHFSYYSPGLTDWDACVVSKSWHSELDRENTVNTCTYRVDIYYSTLKGYKYKRRRGKIYSFFLANVTWYQEVLLDLWVSSRTNSAKNAVFFFDLVSPELR